MSDNRKDPKDECRELFESLEWFDAPKEYSNPATMYRWQGFQAAYAMPRVGVVALPDHRLALPEFGYERGTLLGQAIYESAPDRKESNNPLLKPVAWEDLTITRKAQFQQLGEAAYRKLVAEGLVLKSPLTSPEGE